MSPTSTGDDYDLSATVFTVYATVHSQKREGNRWVDRYFTLTDSATIGDTKQDIMDRLTAVASQLVRDSDAVLISIEITAPAYYEYFQGF